ncbi:MAG: FMN-binding protein [Faecalibacterium sp.]
MRKVMIRNTILMLLATALFAGALTLYLRSANSVSAGEATTGEGGSYTGTAFGYDSDVSVTATYENGALVALSADASGETEAIGGAAADELAAAILAAGSADGVDAVAGATLTSDAVLEAFASCEAQAGRVSGDDYTASAEGFCSDVTVTASFAGDILVGLTIDASGETAEIGGVAAEALTEAILAAGSTDGVDAVASATLTSDAVFAAYADCAAQAGITAAVEEEIIILSIDEIEVTAGADMYSASAAGYESDVEVTLAYTDGVLSEVLVNTADGVGSEAASTLSSTILAAGTASGVDAVAGATITSNAVLAATQYIEEAVLISNSTLYLASAAGYSSDIIVTAGYQEGVLVYLSVDASGETVKVGGVTASELRTEILAAGNADSVDIDLYAGSTISADAVLEAFAACEAMVGSPSNLVTVSASAAGYSSDVVVTATYANGALTALSVDASGETTKVGGVTASELVAEILAAGNADSVDIDLYAGSTITADAVLDAFADCEAQVG